MDPIIDFMKTNYIMIIGVIVAIIVLIMLYNTFKSPFKNVLISDQYDEIPPKQFSPLSQKIDGISLEQPVVPEEIGLAMAYPQGAGAAMSPADSNSFEPSKPGPLLTDHTIPESYGESSLSDPMGTNGVSQGARIIKIKSTGNQMGYKPLDESMGATFAEAYSNGEVQESPTLINGAQAVNYSSSFNPEQNLKLQTSPGQESTLPNCETTYPNVVKYNNFCITEGDIPYGQVVDNKVNPRLVSRWESFTGNYSRENALNPIDGVLYPNLGVLTK